MKVLLAVDGSEQSFDAMRALAHLRRPDRLLILHVLDVPVLAYPKVSPEVATHLSVTIEREMRSEGERLLNNLTAMLPPDVGPVAKRIEKGKPAEVILSLARGEQVDLILLGMRGLSPFKELVLGSVSQHVLSHAPCPVLLVKRPLRTLERVLLPVQGEEDAGAALAFAGSLPFRHPVDVTVLTAVAFAPPPWPAEAAVAEAMKAEVLESAQVFVQDVAARLPADLYRVRPEARIGSPSSVILDEVSSERPDLVLMGSRGRHGVSRFVLGSVSHSILHQAPCALLVYPWPGA